MTNDETIKLAINLNDIARQVAKQYVTIEKDKRKLTFKEIDTISDGIVAQISDIVDLHTKHKDKVNKELFANDIICMALSYAYYNNINLNKFFEISLKED